MNKQKPKRIYLSPPHMTGEEMKFVQEAFESNFIAPMGPQIEAFERDFSQKIGISNALAVSSGTAAMHLALRAVGVGPGDEVFASDLTFIGSVSPIVFQGATPIFIDSDRDTWNMDPDLLDEALEACEKLGKLPKAVIPTDLYGQCADYNRIFNICEKYKIPVVADSAEAVGAEYYGANCELRIANFELTSRECDDAKDTNDNRQKADGFEHKAKRIEKRSKNTESGRMHAGVGADAAVFSFNGNKIITTSCGGMLVSDNMDLVEQARLFAQQAREPFPHYEHCHIGYNYRMSNILAAIGIGQLKALDERVAKKREIFSYYQEALKDIRGIEFMPEASYGKSNRWLTVILINSDDFGADREIVRSALEEENIESRPVWKPMHMQPVFQVEGQRVEGTGLRPSGYAPASREEGKKVRGVEDWTRGKGKESRERREIEGDDGMSECWNTGIQKNNKVKARVIGGEVAEDLFNRGLCLPSGTQMTEANLERVVNTIKKVWKKG